MKGYLGSMLRAQKKHISFHTPGHKRAGSDITELSYSDNLYSPHGVIKKAETRTAEILGAARTCFLTDGSTCGVHAMLYALREKGCKRIALSPYSHRSVTGGMKLLGMEAVYFPARTARGIPLQPTREDMENALKSADALFLTSPDYYGFFPDSAYAKALCEKENKPLAVDGAHGSHLHGTSFHAGNFADLWVDGAHKSLSALTQGAAVSAKRKEWAEVLEEGVRLFRTTSPSYPILASVEDAFLLPRSLKTESAAKELKKSSDAVSNGDWTKLLYYFGTESNFAQNFLEAHGVYPEFNDGNYIMCYLSPCTKKSDLIKLGRLIRKLYTFSAIKEARSIFPSGTAEAEERKTGKEILLPLTEAVGKICARECGVFPPSLPVVRAGERVTRECAERLERAQSTFGLQDKKITVYED